MKDVAILTKYYKNYNYGGMLQGYALYRVIINLGYSCDIISYDVTTNDNPIYKNIFQQCKQYGIKTALSKVLEKSEAKFDFLIKDILKIRHDLFDKFMRDVNAGTRLYSDANLEILNEEYRNFISGSDQIWNPNAVRKLYLQGFVNDDRNRIAYAASIGRDKFSTKEAEILIPYFERFNYLGVREKTGKMVLEKHIGNSIDVVVDPTLLLSGQDWNDIATERPIAQPYALFYFFSDSLKVRKALENICKNKVLKIVLVPFAKQVFNFRDNIGSCIRLNDVGPGEFISAIKHADYVFTDSFHGVVFSIIFNKQFWVFERNKKGQVSMNSRLYDVLDTFGLDKRMVKNLETIELLDEIDYEIVNEILALKKQKSLMFLNNALKG